MIKGLRCLVAAAPVSVAALTLLATTLLAFPSTGDGLADAKQLYDRADFAGTIARLKNANDAASLRLLGQSYFLAGDLKRATETLEKSAQLDPRNSETYLWLGRSYGRRAESAFPLAAPALANKAHANLEKAVQLDPHNWEALDDLFDYYLQAPAFLGGGVEKAARLVDTIGAHDPAQACSARARIAESRKEYDTAESQLRRAIELAPQQVGRLVELGRFLSRRGRYAESDQIFSRALAQQPNSPRVVWGRAHTLIEANRNLPEARELLKRYLTLNLSPDDPTREDAERLLRKVSGT